MSGKRKPPRALRVLGDDQEAIADYLNSTLLKGGEEFAQSIGELMRSRNIVQLSHQTLIDRASLYRNFGGGVEPRVSKIIKVLDSLGFELTVCPKRDKEDKSS